MKPDRCSGCYTAILSSLAVIGATKDYTSFVINTDDAKEQKKLISFIHKSAIQNVIVYVNDVVLKTLKDKLLKRQTFNSLTNGPLRILFVVASIVRPMGLQWKQCSSADLAPNELSPRSEQLFKNCSGEQLQLSTWKYLYDPYSIPGFLLHFQQTFKELSGRISLPNLVAKTEFSDHAAAVFLYVGVLVFQRQTGRLRSAVSFLLRDCFAMSVFPTVLSGDFMPYNEFLICSSFTVLQLG
ncbi:hypothetical protein GEMRC1_005851 [Eukaryota sp. GEM-RC1]